MTSRARFAKVAALAGDSALLLGRAAIVITGSPRPHIAGAVRVTREGRRVYREVMGVWAGRANGSTKMDVIVKDLTLICVICAYDPYLRLFAHSRQQTNGFC